MRVSFFTSHQTISNLYEYCVIIERMNQPPTSSQPTQAQGKPAGYINIVADLTFLQSIMCCNSDLNKNAADTPRAQQMQEPHFFPPEEKE